MERRNSTPATRTRKPPRGGRGRQTAFPGRWWDPPAVGDIDEDQAHGDQVREAFDWRNRFRVAPDLSGPAKCVGYALHSHAGETLDRAHPAQVTLALESGFSDRTVRRALLELEAAGWLYREVRRSPRGRVAGTVYVLELPAHVVEAIQAERAARNGTAPPDSPLDTVSTGRSPEPRTAPEITTGQSDHLKIKALKQRPGTAETPATQAGPTGAEIREYARYRMGRATEHPAVAENGGDAHATIGAAPPNGASEPPDLAPAEIGGDASGGSGAALPGGASESQQVDRGSPPAGGEGDAGGGPDTVARC
jgi:hypothetical protein